MEEYTVADPGTRFKHSERFHQTLEPPKLMETPQSFGPQCRAPVILPSIEDEDRRDSPVFLLETSGRAVLSPRQACAAESAASRSGLRVAMVMLSKTLDLRDNVTCQVYMRAAHIKFYTVDGKKLALGTPLEGFMQAGGVNNSLVPAIHTSDVLRLLLLFRFGGFYHDLDYVVLGPLTQYTNSVLQEKGSFPGQLKVTNSALGLPAKHPLLFAALNKVSSEYHASCWDCLGPSLLTSLLIKKYNANFIADIPKTADIQVIPQTRLVPVHGDHSVEEYWRTSPTPLSHWRNLFSNSSAVHFFSSGSANLRVPREPQFCAYALLGAHYCPLAYYGSPEF